MKTIVKRKSFVFGLFFTLFWGLAFSQTKDVRGVVTDEEGLPLPAVNITVKGTNKGTATNFDGNYELSVEPGQTLSFSIVGFEDKEVKVGSEVVINVQMQMGSALDEVVITALGISREKKSLGYVAEEVKAESLGLSTENNIGNLLSGQAAGVQITGNSNIGGSSNVVIRGMSSLSGSNQPLFVVDGTPMINESINSVSTQKGRRGRDYGNGIGDLNPDDIEEITILRGASASALYGSRAANGVVLITTKKGSKDSKGLGVSISTSMEVGKIYGLPKFQNEYGGGSSQEFTEYNGELLPDYNTDESWGPRLDGTLVRQAYSWFPDDPDYGKATPWVAHPNNVKNFYRTGINEKLNISVSSAAETGRYRISYTNLDQKGVVPNSSLMSNTVNISASKDITKKFSAGANVTYVHTYVKGRPPFGSSGDGQEEGSGVDSPIRSFNQWFQRQVDLDRARDYETVYASNKTWNITSPTNLDAKFWDNPYWSLYNNYTQDWKNRVFGNLFLKYEITDDLSFEINARTDWYTFRNRARIVKGSQGALFDGGEYQEGIREPRELNLDGLFNYSKNISNTISINANAGFNRRDFKRHENTGITIGGLAAPTIFTLSSSVDRPIITDRTYRKRVNSLFGSISLGYNDILYLDGSYRADWSSTLPSDNNAYQYPALSASFIFTELYKPGFLNFGKIRAGWSKVGNDTDPYQLLSTYSPGVSYGSFPINSVPQKLANAKLKPEETFSSEVGLDLTMFNRAVDFGFTYYKANTTNQIMTLPVSATSGYESLVINAGEIANDGIEMTLSVRPFQNVDDFDWEISANWAKNNSEVTKLYKDNEGTNIETVILNDRDAKAYVVAEVGQPYGTFVVDAYARNDKGERLVDDKGNYMREKGVKMGSYLPDFIGGVQNRIRYKNLSLSANLAYQKGGLIFSYTNRVFNRTGLSANTVGLNDKGNPMRDPVSEGGGLRADGVDINGNPNMIYQDAKTYFRNVYDIYEEYLYDASFIKLRDITLSYELPTSWFKNTFLQSASASIYGRNLLTLHKNAPNIDPELSHGIGNVQAIEDSSTPSTRFYGVNINLKF